MSETLAIKTEPEIALIDMDGTICEYYGTLARDIDRVLGSDRDKVSPETLENIQSLIKCQTGWWRDLEPIPLGLHIAKQLEAVGFKLMVLTKGPVIAKNAWTEKVEWCAEHLPHASITITHDKGLTYGKILVDDWPPYIERWLTHRPRGMVIMPDQLWNKDFNHPNVHRVANPTDVFNLRDQIQHAYDR